MTSRTIISRDEARSTGVTRFFTGEPCPRAHLAQRLTSNGLCVECARLHKNKDRAKNIERERARRRTYAKANPERARKWRATTEARHGKRKQIRKPRPYSPLAPEKRLQYQRKWKAKAGPEWRKKEIRRRALRDKLNPEGRRARDRNRSARKRNAAGSHTADDVLRLFELQCGKCATCRRKVSFAAKHVDHVKPLARGGENGRHNLQILCASCNLRKNAKDPIDWARENGMLL